MADLTLPSNITFASLERTGAITPAQANPIKRAYERLLAAGPNREKQEMARHVTAFAETARTMGEGGVFGALFGVVHGAMPGGLDFRVPFVKTKTTVPGDAVVAGLSLIGATFTANHESGISKTFGSLACAGTTLYTFRKVNDVIIAMKQARSGVTPGGGAAPVPGKIGKAEFAGEGPRLGWGTGFLSRTPGKDISEDPIVRKSRSL